MVDVVPVGEVKQYRSPFLRDFWHLNVAMWTSNNALIPDADKEDNLASNALDWPFLYSGMTRQTAQVCRSNPRCAAEDFNERSALEAMSNYVK